MLLYIKLLLYFIVPGNALFCLLSIYVSMQEEGLPSKSSPTPGIIISMIAFFYSLQGLSAARNNIDFDFTRVFLYTISAVLSFVTLIAGFQIEPSVELLRYSSFLCTVSAITMLFFSIVGSDGTDNDNKKIYQRINNETFLVNYRGKPLQQKPSTKISLLCSLVNVLVLLILGLITFHTLLCAAVPSVPGNLIEIASGKSQVKAQYLCEGTRSEKHNFTVLLEHGGGSNFLSMQPLQNELKSSYRVCGYSRLGFAWSEAGELPRTREKFMQEVESLLTNIGEQPPYFVIGHSVGGEMAKAFAKTYPNYVKGIVLLDSVDQVHWFMIDSNTSDWRVVYEVQKKQFGYLNLLRYLSVLGLQYFFIGADGYPDSSKNAQIWSMMLDSNWNSQYELFKNYLQNYEANLVLENNYTSPGYFLPTPILLIPAGLDSTCEQKGLMGSDCEIFERKNSQFLDLQMKTMRAGGPGSNLTICPFPCAHDFAWTRPQWIASKIKPWIENLNNQ